MATELANPQTDRDSLIAPEGPSGQVFEVTKAVSFEAAHYMPTKPEGHPYARIHGHSFRLEVTVAGTVEAGAEWVADFAELTAALKRVAAELDHGLLNEVEGLETPTLERVCLWVAGRLKPDWPGLCAVTLARPSLDERVTLQL
jgi:6-pyruvoyltetrahydropterin/6-carboxytetrahydropterin synthase